MKTKRITALVLTFVIMITMCALSITSASAASDNVSLIYANIETFEGAYPWTPPYTRYYSATGFVEVENLGYQKSVTIHYSNDYGRTWLDAEAEYHSYTWGNKEAWKFTTETELYNIRDTAHITFAIKYEVNGQTYWDNNDGNNYTISSPHGTSAKTLIGNCGLKLASASVSNNVLYGSIILKNLAYQKHVKVRYSVDNWATYQEYGASYLSADGNENEKWNFSVDMPDTWSTVKFAVSYTVNGVTYWDNNFGQNYDLSQTGSIVILP